MNEREDKNDRCVSLGQPIVKDSSPKYLKLLILMLTILGFSSFSIYHYYQSTIYFELFQLHFSIQYLLLLIKLG